MTLHVQGALKKLNDSVKLFEQHSNNDGQNENLTIKLSQFENEIQISRINQFFINILNDFKLIFFIPNILNVS